jgi:hypothetical protein
MKTQDIIGHAVFLIFAEQCLLLQIKQYSQLRLQVGPAGFATT